MGYQKGCVLASLGQYSQAIEELKQGQELAPREPCIHFRLGKACRNRRYAQSSAPLHPCYGPWFNECEGSADTGGCTSRAQPISRCTRVCSKKCNCVASPCDEPCGCLK